MKFKNIFIGVLLFTFFLMGRYTSKPIVETKISTIEKWDTITIEKPIVKTITETKYVERFLPTTIYKTDTIRDSIKVYVPMSTYNFSEPNLYDITISGYDVTLDKLQIYPKTIYRTETNTIKSTSRFGVGIQVGYGFTNNSLSPYIGIGLQYNLFTF